MLNYSKYFCLSFLFVVSLQAQTWFNNGPFGGYITAVAIDPVDTNIVYAGTYGAGMYRSNDGGLSWVQMNEGIPVRTDSSIGSPTEPSWWFGDYFPVTTIRMSPQNPFHVYVGTYGSGIVQSFDKGETWIVTNTGLPDSANIHALWIHPQDSTFLLCGTDYPNGGLYKSTDSGNSWMLVDSIPHGETYFITTIAHNPGYPDSIYVGFSSAGEPGLSWGLFQSPDRGSSWELVNQDFSFYDLQIDPLNPQKLWSVVYTGFLEWMLFYSVDGGVAWNLYPDANNPWTEIFVLYADNNWNLYVVDGAAELLRKSTDHGASWVSFPLTLPSYPLGIFHGMGPNMAANPQHPEIIYFGTDVAMYRSEDGGATYELKENGMINTYINEVAVNPENPQILYAGGDQGLWKSTDGGNSWIRLSTSSVNAIAIDPQHPDTLYWGGEDLMRSFDGGQTWQNIKGNIPGVITDIVIRTDSTQIIFVSSYIISHGYLFKSSDHGDSWLNVFDSFPASLWIEDIAIYITNSQTMYFGTGRNASNHGLYKSVDGGLSWDKISDPGQIISIALHPTSPETLFIATYEQILASYDGGISFTEIGQTIPSHHMSKIILDSEHPPHLFAGTKNKGVFYSLDFGQNWSRLSGEYNPRITDIDWVSSQNRIYLGTHGSGVWQGDDVILSITEDKDIPSIPETAILLPAYPNPFNEQTVIPFYLLKRSEIQLSIYNIRGQLIRRFERKMYAPGYHAVPWNGTSDLNKPVASGIYFIKLDADAKTSIRKVVLLK